MINGLKVFSLFLILISFSSCSPGYVIRASYEELNILLKRRDIKELIQDSSLEQEKKDKLSLVLAVRKFCKELGLVPKGSFSQYSEIDSDVLIWVLSGSLSYKLEPKTWWFPIVGSIPYKGYFSLEDAKEAREELRAGGFDTFLRSSDAFSTLGWFDDPLLSTVLQRDKLIIANTVIHEILHNTIWIKNNAAFNETMANAVGGIGAIEFFKSINDFETAQRAEESLKRELDYSKLLSETTKKLNALYEGHSKISDPLEQERQEIFTKFKIVLKSMSASKSIDTLTINNAYIIAQATYYKNLEVFHQLYEKQGRSLKNMITDLKDLKEMTKDDPFNELANYAK